MEKEDGYITIVIQGVVVVTGRTSSLLDLLENKLVDLLDQLKLKLPRLKFFGNVMERMTYSHRVKQKLWHYVLGISVKYFPLISWCSCCWRAAIYVKRQ